MTSKAFSLRAPAVPRDGDGARLRDAGARARRWCVVSYGGFAPPDFLPSPTEVVKGTLQLFLQYDLWDAILMSTWRIVMAFLLASAVALPLGILMGAFSRSTVSSSRSWRRCATCRSRRSSRC